MRVFDLFSGIGAFSLGLHRAGMTTVAFVEQDDWCQRLLAIRWPGVPIYDDVRDVDAARLRADGIDDVDVVCGGFPCQDISVAGKGAGLAGERSGLWREFARIVGDVRPRYVIVENVAALLGRGHGEVLGDLAALGYDAEWHCIPAAAVGAPHRRDRVWIVAADAGRDGCVRGGLAEHGDEQGASGPVADGLGTRGWRDRAGRGAEVRPRAGSAADPARGRVEGHGADRIEVAFAPALALLLGRDDAGSDWQNGPTSSPLRRVDDGIAPRLDKPRLHALGNSLVPQIPELIGRAIMEREAA